MDRKLANKKSKFILWVDLEMTGLDPVKDRILEVGAIVTDWKFKELATYESGVKVAPSLMRRRMLRGPSRSFWESQPAACRALFDQNRVSPSVRAAEDALLAFIDTHFEPGTPVLLAGNSIHMDRQFIARYWPRLDARLHYRMLDVTSWKVVFAARYKMKFAKQEPHRAIDDIRGSIEELQYYLKKLDK